MCRGAITNEQRRQTLIEQHRAFLTNQSKRTTPDEDFSKLLSPFLFNFPTESIGEVLTDEQILQRVGCSLQPKGNLEQKGFIVLFVRDNRRLSVGDKLQIKYRGETQVIEVISITTRSFDLKLNDTVVRFTY
jgi:hypothetical protein